MKTDVLFSREVSERPGVLTIIQTSFIPKEERAIVTLQTFCSGEGAQCNSFMIHPSTARKLARVLMGLADQHELHTAKQPGDNGYGVVTEHDLD